MTSFSSIIGGFTFKNLFIYLCVCLGVDVQYIHNWANLFPHHIPVNKLRQSPPRCEAVITGFISKSTNKLTTKNASFFFLCFLLLQRKRKPSLYFRQTLYNKTTTKPWPRKVQTERCCCWAVPRLQGHFLVRSHLESRHVWPFQRHPPPSEMKRGKHMCYSMGNYFGLTTRDLGLVVCDLLYCLLFMYIYVQVWYSFGAQSWKISHGRHRHWVKDSISPSNMLSNSSFCYFFFVFLNFRHASILFPPSHELLVFYIHIPQMLGSRNSRFT